MGLSRAGRHVMAIPFDQIGGKTLTQIKTDPIYSRVALPQLECDKSVPKGCIDQLRDQQLPRQVGGWRQDDDRIQ
jgi:hypothetical protein